MDFPDRRDGQGHHRPGQVQESRLIWHNRLHASGHRKRKTPPRQTHPPRSHIESGAGFFCEGAAVRAFRLFPGNAVRAARPLKIESMKH
jgi:hypothetical protein